MKGYKVFNNDWTCRGFEYKLGKTYVHEGTINLCETGFHFCKRAIDCFNYYEFDSSNKVAEIEAVGKIKTDGTKSVTDKITIIRELSWHEVLDLVNIGKNCTGIGNSGYRNSGNCNSGDYNSGDCNSGDYNSGDYNSGDCNSGNYNSGDYNSGNYNSGYFNSGYRNSGFFCTGTATVNFFDKPTNLSFMQARLLNGMHVICDNYKNNIWINSETMNETEKKLHPEYKTTGGYLKVLDYKEAWKAMWGEITEAQKQSIMDLPNFDKNKFFKITGIQIKEGEKE